jgi:hypothetical protein
MRRAAVWLRRWKNQHERRWHDDGKAERIAGCRDEHLRGGDAA